MSLTTRTIEKTDSVLYIIPAIQLKPLRDEETKRYGERAIHIGLYKRDDDKVACLCGQHHKQPSDAFEFLNVKSHPNITCGGCIRSLRKLLRESSGKPYEVIMDAINQKIEDAEFHTKKEGSQGHQSYGPYDVEPESRILEGSLTDPLPRLRPDGLTIKGAIDVFGNRVNPIVHAINTEHGPTKSLCGDGCNLMEIDADNLKTFPTINCPECAKLIRERFPEEAPDKLVYHHDEIAFSELQIDELESQIREIQTYLFKLRRRGMAVVDLNKLKEAAAHMR